MLRKRITTAALVIALLISAGAFGVAPIALAQEESPAFTDVPDEHTAKAAIEYCALNEFVLGYGDGRFNPDGNITREQFVTVWARTFHARMHNFSDATKTVDEMDNAIVLMYGLGFINGVSSTEFSRYSNITREQVAQIVKNTYLPGVDGHDMYLEYDDSTAISDWARNAVSACRDKGIFGTVTTNNMFEPAKPITRAEVCMVIYNLMEEQSVLYSISVATIEGGTVTPTKSLAAAGESVMVVVVPDPGKQLVSGSLMANDTPITGKAFIMPAKNVTITAEFEDVPALASIAVKTAPETAYTVGDTLDIVGLMITATYSDGSTKDIDTGLTTDPAEGAVLNAEGTQTVTVSYTEGEVTRTTNYDITVSAAA